MSIASFSVNRPIFTTMVTLIVIIMGAVSLYRIPVDLMPDVTYPTLTVSTQYENASPAEVEELITRPVEEAMGAVAGVEEISSTSSEGSSNVRITFEWGTDLDVAASDIRDRLDRVIPRLPEEADRPTLRKFDLASFPILILGAAGKLDPLQMRKLIDNQVKYRIERVPGVAALDIRGGHEREIHVLLDPDKFKALDIPLSTLIQNIKTANINLPAGTLESGNYDITIRTPAEFTNIDQLRDTAISTRDGNTIRLRDVADIEDAKVRETSLVRVNGMPGVRMAVNKQSGENTVKVAAAVLKEIEAINRDIPQIAITPIMDTSDYIQRSITNVGRSALFGGMYAILVLLLFLRNIRSTSIIATAIPISIVASFMLIYFGGFTLNLMTLGGLALGVGMLVDNSIVVLENIYRIRESRNDLSAAEAAETGTGEVAMAIIASTLTTVVVFLPLIFVRGMAGVMFKQLAYVVSFALLCSMGAALTIVPMLASRFLQPVGQTMFVSKPLIHRLFDFTGFILGWVESKYLHLLNLALRRRLRVAIAAAAVFAASLAAIPLVGTELMPASDEGEVRINAEMEVGTKLSVMDGSLKKIEDIVNRAVPEIRSTVTSIGGWGWGSAGSHNGDMRVALQPLGRRKRSSEQIAADLRPLLSSIPGTVIRTRAGQGLFVLRMISGGTEGVVIEIRGYDLDTADVIAHRVRELVENVRGITDVRVSREGGQPERLVVVDRAKAEAMQVTVHQVASLLQTALGGTKAGYFREGGDEFNILVKLKDAEKQPLDEIMDLTIVNAAGQPVVLKNIVNIRSQSGPVRIERRDQERVVTITANISGRDLGSIIADVREQLGSIPVPRDFAVAVRGDYEEQQEAFRELGLGLILALVLVYMVMACLYESLRDPLVVMFSVPLAAIGVVAPLLLTRTTFNIQSYIGCIMLGGIVVNNAILLVDHTNLLRRRDGMETRDAIVEAGRRRLRPILMTALTTMLGLLPLAIGMGEGGEAQAPLARAVIGGLLSSTLLTLVLIPVVYSFFEEKRTPNENKTA